MSTANILPLDRVQRIWQITLKLDNYVIGLAVSAAAIYDWATLYDGIETVRIYFSQHIFALSSLSALSTLFSAIYLTLAAIILLSLGSPKSRYQSVLPNLVAAAAGFGTYLFIFVPRGDVLGVNVYVALSLISVGSVIVIVSLVFLRQAFTVTPQARFLVTSGPYSIIRHPMYVGNILSLGGLALLIDSYEAFAYFLICLALQISRALYEEKLLRGTFPEYSDYADKVGRFIPILMRNRQLLLLASLTLLAFSPRSAIDAAAASSHQELGVPAVPAEGAAPETRSVIAHAAVNKEEWAKTCDGLSRKAKSGTWFNKADKDKFVKLDDAVNKDRSEITSISECKDFLSLHDKCEAFVVQWANEEIKADGFMQRIETTQGCQAIVGFESICDTLKDVAKKGIRLSDSRKSIMVECLSQQLRNTRYDLLRPML